jgi:hypothetical protein
VLRQHAVGDHEGQHPVGQTGFFIVTAQTSSSCSGDPSASDACLIRLTVNGNPVDGPLNLFEAGPTVGIDTGAASHDAVLTTGTLAAGTYTLAVQWAVVGSAAFGLNNNKLVIERVRVS